MAKFAEQYVKESAKTGKPLLEHQRDEVVRYLGAAADALDNPKQNPYTKARTARRLNIIGKHLPPKNGK